MSSVTLRDVSAARARIGHRVLRTPQLGSQSLGRVTGQDVVLKFECRQTTGSFKLRGATNALLALSGEERARGVVTASTGNHGRALAHAARAEGVRAVVCMSSLVPGNKVAAVQALGAEVRIVGRSQDDAQEEVDRLAREKGLVAVPPFDHPDVIAGQGTAGLEIVEDRPDVATLIVPLSGGGLASGLAVAVKGLRPHARVIGVSMQRGAAMRASLEAGAPVAVEEVETLADSLGGGIGLANRFTFALCRELLDDVVLVTEEEIAGGVRHLFHEEGEIVEGAAAVGVAALLAGKARSGGPIAVFVSGRNIDLARHAALVGGAGDAAQEIAR